MLSTASSMRAGTEPVPPLAVTLGLAGSRKLREPAGAQTGPGGRRPMWRSTAGLASHQEQELSSAGPPQSEQLQSQSTRKISHKGAALPRTLLSERPAAPTRHGLAPSQAGAGEPSCAQGGECFQARPKPQANQTGPQACTELHALDPWTSPATGFRPDS